MNKRKPIASRRGSFTTWGDSSWNAVLFRSTNDSLDPAEALLSCKAVAEVQRDVTAETLQGTLVPPAGKWALVVTHKTMPWSTIVCSEHGESLFGDDGLFSDVFGESLVTGDSDSAGVVYLRLRKHNGIESTTEIEWVSDGVRWETPDPEDDPDDDGDTYLGGARFSRNDAEVWLQQRTSAEDAHQTLLTDLDAYVPSLHFQHDAKLSNVGRLEAAYGHDDCLSDRFIQRIDVIRFGPLKEFTRSETASRELESAVGRVDLEAVRTALSKGATTGRLPESRDTALWLSLEEASGYDAKNRPVTFDVVMELLLAGANPNELAERAKSPVEQLLQIDYVQTRGKTKKAMVNRLNTLALLDKLIEFGLDVNAISYGSYAYGYRPLHSTALHNQPEMVRRLLEAGADLKLTNDRDATPWISLNNHFESMANHFNKRQRVSIEDNRERYAEVVRLIRPDS
ncbi:ankyrin repeat domain-containing protein [Rhodopirellula halodulae]|uniref:ankyrin repeat domain-containing protein n=1 Tax=Rhodopirellula halodulae TaxID=2894198 RepID=UPI001E34841F|nr:ankyrin repeat domain-containing protein [Rhodopirellula sp. JC737]MCC9658816.1 hypothetical protein [Rhodopirellula sp. JC737]